MAIRDLLLKISGDGDDAKRELADVAKDVAAFGEQEAEAVIGVDTAKAESAIERATRELREFGRISVEAAAGVEIAKGEAQIERLKANLVRLSNQPASVKVDAATTKALLDLDRVQARVDRLKLAHADVNVDVDSGSTSVLNIITGAVDGLVSAIGSGGGGLAGGTARVSAGFISFGAATGPLAAILAALAVTIGVALVGAIGALVASLAAAVAAVGVLAVALAGALGPVLAVVIAAVVRFARVIQALRAQSAAAQQAQQQAAAGSSAVTAAAEQQAAAARALTDANERLGQATTQAYREMADAAEAASDAVRSVADAEASRDQANLNVRKSVDDLATLRGELGATGKAFDAVFKKFTDVAVDTSGISAALAGASGGGGPDGSDQLKLEQAILNVRQARNAEKNAIDAVSDAETNRTRTQQRANEFARQGIQASDGYRAALRGVADAQRQVNAAAREQSLAAAQAKAKVLTDNLTDSEQKLLKVIQQVSAAIKDALGPATDAVIGGLATSLGNVATIAKALKPAFTVIGAAIGQALAQFSGELVKPEWISALNALALGGAQLVGIFTADIFIPFLQILRDIAVAALPLLLDGLQQFGDMLQGLAADTGSADLTAIFTGLVGQLGAWLNLGLAIGAVFLALFKNAAGPGKGLVDTLTKGALALAAWLNSKEGTKAVKDFFDKTLPVAKEFVRSVIEMIGAFVRFGIAAAPAVKTVLDVLTFVLTHIKEIALVLLPLGILFGSTFAIATAAVIGVIAVINNLPKIIGAVKTAVGAVGGAFKTAFDFAKNQVSAAINFIGEKFSAFAKTAKSIGTTIGNGIVSGLSTAFKALEGIGKTVLNGLVTVLNLGIDAINKLTPGPLKIAGHTIIPGIPDIPHIPELAAGGITTGSTFAQIGEAGREAVLPLTRRVFGELAAAITAQMRLAAPRAGGPQLAFAGAPTGNVAGRDGRGGVHIEHFHTHIDAPAGELPDVQTTATGLTRLMERRAGGNVRQD